MQYLGTSPLPSAISQSFLCPYVGAKEPGARRAPLQAVCAQTHTPVPSLPAAPPRLQLVPGPRGLRCAGILMFYHGSLGGTISYKDQDWTQDLGNRICAALQCGTFLQHLTEADEATRPQAPGESQPLPIRWKIQNASCASLEQCFRKVQPLEGGQTLALVCSGE